MNHEMRLEDSTRRLSHMSFKEYTGTEQFLNECETAFQHAKGKRYTSSNTTRAASPAPRAHGPGAKPLEDRQRSVGRIAFEEPEEAHADHFKNQDLTAEMIADHLKMAFDEFC